MKKIIVFGASGRTGIPLVEQALERGFEVTAFVRDPQKLTISHPQLKVIKGDVLNEQQVVAAIAGHEAVLSVLGHTKGGAKDLLVTSISHIHKGMKQHGVKRLIQLTGAGVTVPKDVRQGFVSRMFGVALKVLAKDLWLDSVGQKEYIFKSGVEWTIVRAPRLLDGALTKHYQTGYFKFKKPMIHRADVAHFMLEELEKNEYVLEAPLIGSR